MVSYTILEARWPLDSSRHKRPFSKTIFNDVSVKSFTGRDQTAAMSSMRWKVLVACFQDFKKDMGKNI